MSEYLCPNGHETSSRTGQVPSGCPQHDCDRDLQRVTADMQEFADELGVDVQTVVARRAEA
jgi:hypothetical protein